MIAFSRPTRSVYSVEGHTAHDEGELAIEVSNLVDLLFF